MVNFKLDVVDFKKINLKGITKFCEKYNANVKMSVKMDSNGIGIKIYDEDRKTSICTYGVRNLTQQEKEKIVGDSYNENDEMDRIYMRADHELSLQSKNENELRLVYLFAMYISSYTDMLLLNFNSKEVISSTQLKEVNTKMLESWITQYSLRKKYVPELKKWSDVSTKAIKLSFWFWVVLIGCSILSVSILIVMMEVWKIDNPWLLSLSFVVLGAGLFIYFSNRWLIYQKARKELIRLRYEYDKALCELHEDRIPRKPSGSRVKTENFISDVFGVMILPLIIIGCVLFTFDKIALGAIVMITPCLILFCIKKFYLDVHEEKLRKVIFDWLDECVMVKTDKNIISLCLDLFEKGDNKWGIELLGCTNFDMDNSMWTKNDVCELNVRKFEFSYKGNWENAQYLVGYMVRRFLNESESGKKLTKYKGIALGFTDGAVDVIYFSDDEK